ncbi:MAG: hypothetical protein H7095_02360 [Pseudopedobacter sp.]|nr:hypothetical protein [Deinococcales bacterium]
MTKTKGTVGSSTAKPKLQGFSPHLLYKAAPSGPDRLSAPLEPFNNPISRQSKRDTLLS